MSKDNPRTKIIGILIEEFPLPTEGAPTAGWVERITRAADDIIKATEPKLCKVYIDGLDSDVYDNGCRYAEYPEELLNDDTLYSVIKAELDGEGFGAVDLVDYLEADFMTIVRDGKADTVYYNTRDSISRDGVTRRKEIT